MDELKLTAKPDTEGRKCAPPSEFWFVVAVDSSGWGFIVDCHPDATAFDMVDGTACDDNGIEHPDDPGLYRLTNMDFTTGTDWETGIVDEWSWSGGDVEKLWTPDGDEGFASDEG